MIRNLFVLIFAACLTGISQCDKDSGFRNAAYDNFDVYDQYEGSLRMRYGEYDDSSDQAGHNRNVPNHKSDSPKDKVKDHPPINATHAADKTSSKKGTTSKMPPSKKGTGTTTKKPTVIKVFGPKKTNMKQKSKTKSVDDWINTSPSSNGITTTPTSASKVTPKNRLVTIKYNIFQQEGTFVSDDLSRIHPFKNVYILFPGFLESNDASFKHIDYVNQFFKLISSVIVSRCNCTMVGVEWSFKPPLKPKPFIQYRAAIITGRRVGNAINQLIRNELMNGELFIIGHDLGNLAAVSFSNVLIKPVDYIYGLDQRQLEGNHRNFYLRQDSGKLVQTITTNGVEYNYGHRNFYPNGGNLSLIFGLKDQCNFCLSFQLLADDMVPNRSDHHSTFCSTYDDYLKDYCEHFPQVSYFNVIPARYLPTGNYFITEAKRPIPYKWNK